MPDPGQATAGLFVSMRGYRRHWLTGDTVSAFTLAAIAIPEQLATARLVGMPPTTGLLAFAAGSVAFAALGKNRFISVGADSTIAPIMASALVAIAAAGSPQYAGTAAILALQVGAILLIAGLLRAGWIADLLSIPVTTGFLAGISIQIIIAQLPTLLGVDVPNGHALARLLAIMHDLPQAHPYPLAIGGGVLTIALVGDRISSRLPGALLGIVASGLVVWILALRGHGTEVLAALTLAAPRLTLAVPSWDEFAQLLPTSVIVAAICMMQTAAVARALAAESAADGGVSRDFAAVGVANILAALIGAFAVNSSPPRSAVVKESGGETQLAGLFAVLIVILVALTAAGAFAFVPAAALAGVLIFIAVRLFRVATMVQIYRQGGYEILLVAASAVLVAVLPIETGVALAIFLSLVHGIYIVARPDCAVLSRVPGTTVWWKEPSGEDGERKPGVLVFAPAAPINFTNASYVRGRLEGAVAAMPEPCRLIVIEAHGVIDFDFTGSRMLQRLVAELRGRDIQVALARLESQRAQRAAALTGLLAALGSGCVFRSVEEAIESYRRQREPSGTG
jgi:sulfate permease, SulP family